LETLSITGNDLTPEAVADVAYLHRKVALSDRAKENVIRARRLIEDMIARDMVVYGVNTGFGKLSDVSIPKEDVRKLQVNLIRSHACGVGAPLSEAETRAAMLLRANAMAKGYSGVRPLVIEQVLELLNKEVHPIIPCRGSVSASGDLAPSAHMALVLIGEGEAIYQNKRMSGAAALKAAARAPLELEAKEGLAMLNGTQFVTALGVLALLRAETLIDTADVAGAMSLEPLMGTGAAFDARVQRVRPHPGQQITAQHVLRQIAQSAIVASHKDCRRVQDAYSLRCMPQVHGAVRDALRYARQILHVEINSATDNPLVFAEGEQVLAGGNFHAAPVGYALDFMAIVMADLANISERRIERLNNPDLSGLPAFLAHRPGLSSGFMMAQVTAAALASENKVLAHPASVDSIPTSANKEDHVSMGMAAALKLQQILDNLEAVLAIELLCACQGIDLLRPLEPGVGTKKACELVRAVVPFLEEDRPISSDIEKIRGLIRDKKFSRLLT
jgi:histidine ammonia-lyase